MMMQPVIAGPTAFRLTCRAEKLEAKDGIRLAGLGSTSDPYVVIRNMQNQVCGKSAVVFKNLNPKWKPFEVDALQCGGMNAPIMVEVYDWDKDGKDDFIGHFRTTLAELTSKINVSTELINNKKRGRAFYKNSGRFTVLAVEAIQIASKHAKCIEFWFEGKDLDRKDITGKSDPYFVIYGCPKVFNAFGTFWGSTMTTYKKTKVGKPGKVSKYSGIAGSPVMVYKSKAIMKTLNPSWDPFVLESRLCGGPNAPITVEVWDYDSSGEHDFIGACRTSINDLMVEGAVIPLINSERKKNVPFYRNSGTLRVKSAKPAAAPTTNELAIVQAKIILAGKDLASRDLLSKSDPFITFKGMNNQVIYRSEEYINNKNPEFKEIIIPVQNCGGLDGKIKVTFWDWDGKGKHDIIGETTVTLRELSFYTQNPKWRLVCDKWKNIIGYRNSGFMVVKKLEFVQGTPIVNTPMMMQPGMAMGMGTVGMQPGMMQMGMQMKVQPGMQMGMQPGMGYGGMPIMQPGMQMRMQPGMGYGGMPIMQPSMQPGMQMRMQPGMQPGMQMRMQPGMQMGMQPGMGYGGMPIMQPGMGYGGMPMMQMQQGQMQMGMQPGMPGQM